MPDAPFPPAMMPCIEDFFRDIHPRLHKDWLIYDEVFATSLFFPLQRKREMERMIRMARGIPHKVVFEIGADKGGSLYHWCMQEGVNRVIACEIRGCPYKHLFEKHFPHIDFLWLEESSFSRSAVDKVLTWLGGDRINVLFLDGDKSAFLLDFNAYQPFCSRPGLVFLHDIQDFEPGKSFATLRDNGLATEEILDRSEGEGMSSLVQKGYLPESPYEAWLAFWRGRSCGVGVVRLKERK